MSFEVLTTEELFKRLDKLNHKQLHIHHTWRPNHSNFNGSNHQRIQEGMKNYHINTNGWRDIGQNLSLFPDGVWLIGRPLNQNPASIKGWNTGALCVEMIGNFDKGMDILKDKQEEHILKLIGYFINRYGEDSIKFHREGPGVSKTCPGTSLNKQIMITKAKKRGVLDTMTKEELKKFIQEVIREELRPSLQGVNAEWAKDHAENLNSKYPGAVDTDDNLKDYMRRGQVIALVDKITDMILI